MEDSDETLRDTDASSVEEEEEDSSTEYSSDEVEVVTVVEPVAATDEEPERTAAKIAEWVAYKEYEKMRNYLHYEMNNGTPIRHIDQFLDALTTMAMAKDEPEEFVQLYDLSYRWRVVTSNPMPSNTWLNYKTNRMQKKKKLPPSDVAREDSKPAAVDPCTSRAAYSAASSASDVASASATASVAASASAEPAAASAEPAAASASAPAAAASISAPAAASAPVASDVGGEASVQGSAVASVAALKSQQIRKKLPKNTKFLLEIKTYHQKWKPWISLQPSTVHHSAPGLPQQMAGARYFPWDSIT